MTRTKSCNICNQSACVDKIFTYTSMKINSRTHVKKLCTIYLWYVLVVFLHITVWGSYFFGLHQPLLRPPPPLPTLPPHATHLAPLISHHSSHSTHLTTLISHHSSHTTHHTALISPRSSRTTHLTPPITQHSSHHAHLAPLISHHPSHSTRLTTLISHRSSATAGFHLAGAVWRRSNRV